jgi:transposase
MSPLPLPPLDSLSSEQKDALILELCELVRSQAARIAELEAQVQALRAQVQTLQAQLAKDSRTSGKPPSSDGLKKPPRPKSERSKSGRRPGGQKGHDGQTLKQTDQPDRIVYHRPEFCPGCGQSLARAAVVDRCRRQVFDLPPLALEVTEHQALVLCCPQCQRGSAGSFPPGVEQPVQYGERLKALAVYLKDYQLLPYERQRELFEDLFGHRLSAASLVKAEQVCAQGLGEPLHAIRQQLLEAGVVGFDETGLRVEGRLAWLHTASSAELSYYQVHAKRGSEAMDAIGLLPAYRGVAVHDGLSSYFGYDGCPHALCNAHHLRELRFIHEQYGQVWAADLRLCLRLAHRLKQDHSPPLTDALKARIGQWYDQILAAGEAELPADPPPPPGHRGRRKQHPARNLHQRLCRYKTETLRFLYQEPVPFDNNGAERDLRMIKTQQKVSGTFRCFEGAQRFARIRSYISTARKQGQRVLEVIGSVFTGRPWMPGTELVAE